MTEADRGVYMKRFWKVLVMLVVVLSLWGCTRQEKIYTTERNGIQFVVDTENRTISDGVYTYHYGLSEGASSSTLTITYPNGASYWDTQNDKGNGSSGWSDDYKADAYVSGWTLSNVVRQTIPKPANSGKIIAGLIVIGLSIAEIAFPQGLWYLRYGWHFKSAEPSDASLMLARVGGVVGIILGAILILVAIGG